MLTKIINENIIVFEGTDINWAISQGFKEMDVVKDINGNWASREETETPEYKVKELENKKLLKLSENEQAREVEFIVTSFGKLKTATPIGPLSILVPNIALIAQAQNSLPQGFLRFYSENNEVVTSPQLNKEQAMKLYSEIIEAYNTIDTKSTAITKAIKEATTCEELEEIKINY